MFAVIVPRLAELYRWSASELRIPDVTGLVCDATPAYAWDHIDRNPWMPPPRRLVRTVRRALPPPQNARESFSVYGAALHSDVLSNSQAWPWWRVCGLRLASRRDSEHHADRI